MAYSAASLELLLLRLRDVEDWRANAGREKRRRRIRILGLWVEGSPVKTVAGLMGAGRFSWMAVKFVLERERKP